MRSELPVCLWVLTMSSAWSTGLETTHVLVSCSMAGPATEMQQIRSERTNCSTCLLVLKTLQASHRF